MPRAFRININTERRKLAECFHRTRKIIESTLTRMEQDPEKVSATLVDVCVKSIRQMTGLLADIDQMDKQAEAAKRSKSEAGILMSEMPFRKSDQSAPPEEEYQLPFPALKHTKEVEI
jgi:hypothetical protein